MTAPVSRAVMLLAVCCLDERHGEWSAAMRAEFETAVAEGQPLSFAIGCLTAAWREMLTREEGVFTLTGYALALIVMMPMAALQIGCALFGFPYLYPGRGRLSEAMLEGREHEALVRAVYQGAVPALALLLLLLGIGHLRIAWAMLEHDWSRVRRLAAFVLANAVTLILFMAALFLDGRQALLQAAVLAVELVSVAALARWHAQRAPTRARAHPR